MRTGTLPTYHEVGELPREVTGFIVPASFEDENGHMNIRHYFDLAARAISSVFSRVGITDEYRATRGLGFFTAEHHLRYFSEIHVGERISAYFRVLERSDKVVHAMVFLVNDTTHRLAFTLELIAPHVDLGRRRTAPMPADIAQAWDDEIAKTEQLSWDAPVCGSMGIRR